MDPTHPRLEPSLARDGADAPAPQAAAQGAVSEAGTEPAADETLAPGAVDEAVGGFSGVSLTSMRWRALNAPTPQAEHVARNPSLPTFVGLIMLILTFFIVLSSISINDRKKSEAAMASLQDAFSGTAVPNVARDNLDSAHAARDFVQGLTSKIQSLVPLMGGQDATAAEDQVLWLPVSLAFAGDSNDLAAEFTPVLQELLTASGKIPARFDYKVELWLCESEAGDRLRRRAAALADGLARLQAPLARFVIGVQACKPDRMAFAVALAPQPVEAAP